MSSIFNLLGGLTEPDRDQIKPMARARTSHEIGLNPVKTMGDIKPKGLSIRSKSDMNALKIVKKNVLDKEQDCLKLKVTQVDNNGRPISPGKQTPAKKSSKLKECLKEGTFNKSAKKQLHDDVFKKPLSLSKNVKKIPKPEKLAYYYDIQRDFDDGYIEDIEREFKDFVSKKKVNMKTCENILAIDSENLLLDIPKLTIDKTPDEELFDNKE